MKTPGQNVKVAHAGVGSFGHLAGVLVAQEIGATVTQVPYRGAGPALNDLLAGEVDLSSHSAVQSAPLVKAGKLKAYAIIGPNPLRRPARPADHGRARLQEARSRFLARAACSRRHAAADHRRLNAALRHALADARVKKTFADGGMDMFPPGQETPEAAATLLKSEIKLWGDVIRANNITVRSSIAAFRRRRPHGRGQRYSAAFSSGGLPERNCSSSAASSALAATRWRALTGPKPRIFSGIAASPTASG